MGISHALILRIEQLAKGLPPNTGSDILKKLGA